MLIKHSLVSVFHVEVATVSCFFGFFVQQARASTPRTRTPERHVRSMTTIRKSSDRPALSLRDSLDHMHQSYSGWTEYVLLLFFFFYLLVTAR